MSLGPVSQGSGGRGRRRSSIVCAVDHLEGDLVDVDRVGVRGEVVDLPDLGRPDGRVLGDRVVPPSGFPVAGLGLAMPEVGLATVPNATRAPAESRTTLPASVLTGRSRVLLVERHLARRRSPARAARAPAGTSWLGGVLGRGAVAGTTRNRITCPVVSGSAGRSRRPARRRRTARRAPMFCRMIVGPDRHVGEVDDHVGALRRAEQQLRRARPGAAGSRRRCRSARTGRPSVHFEDQETRVADVQEAEPVAALLDVEERPGVAVDHHRVAEELRVPDRRDVARRPSQALSGMNGICSSGETPSKNARLSG